MKMSIIVIVSIRSFFVPICYLLRFAAFASGSCYYAAIKDGSESKTIGRFTALLSDLAADREKKAMKAEVGSEMPFIFAK